MRLSCCCCCRWGLVVVVVVVFFFGSWWSVFKFFGTSWPARKYNWEPGWDFHRKHVILSELYVDWWPLWILQVPPFFPSRTVQTTQSYGYKYCFSNSHVAWLSEVKIICCAIALAVLQKGLPCSEIHEGISQNVN